MSFYVDDIEDSWNYETKFNYIFGRFLTGSIRDFPKFFQQAFEYTAPPDPHSPRSIIQADHRDRC